MDALFEPRGVIITGVSSHPGKVGFTALLNVLTSGYRGKVFAISRDGGDVLGLPTVPEIADVPDGEADLVLVCGPPSMAAGILEASARKGVRCAFIAAGGFRETGGEGRKAEIDLVATAHRLGILLAGPNGQGIVSTPRRLSAQIAAPYPPPGRISIASQSGNCASALMNESVRSGVGIARAVSAGNAAAITIGDYLEYFARDPETGVSIAYLEDVGDGKVFSEQVRAAAEMKPVVLLKGGSTPCGARAAASHTGALATESVVLEGVLRQAGACQVWSLDEAFDVAATFATQPLPKGPNTMIVSTVGGMAVLCADALDGTELRLLPMPARLRAAIDEKLPPRWSQANPIDMAAGEGRDTVPDVLALVAEDPEVDAVIYLGLGIQSNIAGQLHRSAFYPDHGTERMVRFHYGQDRRYAEAAAEVSEYTGKPVLVATELAVCDPDNPGPRTVGETGRYCYPSANRAVNALAHVWRYARWRQRRGLPTEKGD